MALGPGDAPTLVAAAVALAVLVRAAGVAVSRSTALAQRLGVPDVVVGTTVVAVGTSLPEIGSHLVASVGIRAGELDYEVASATVLGGNMGSSITQQLLLLGVFLVGYGRFRLTDEFVRTSYLPMLAAAALLLGLAVDGTVSVLDGVVLLAAFAAYLLVAVRQRDRAVRLAEGESRHVARDAAVAVVALGAVLGAAFVLLAAVERVVDALALGGSMVGVVTLGLAAALPELSTVVDALRRRAPNVAVGTLVGSNVVNPLLAVGLGGVVSTYRVPAPVIWLDLPVKLVAGVGLLAAAFLAGARDGTLRRRDGAALVAAYFAFVAARLVLFGGQ